jgi:hypothetical protein
VPWSTASAAVPYRKCGFDTQATIVVIPLLDLATTAAGAETNELQVSSLDRSNDPHGWICCRALAHVAALCALSPLDRLRPESPRRPFRRQKFVPPQAASAIASWLKEEIDLCEQSSGSRTRALPALSPIMPTPIRSRR